jgi:hypothetical protein
MHLNIMMDASCLYTKPFHPIERGRLRDLSDRIWLPGGLKHYTRTERPVKYYFIDFGLSRRYNPNDGPPLELPIFGGDKTAPEFQTFPTGVYYLRFRVSRYDSPVFGLRVSVELILSG